MGSVTSPEAARHHVSGLMADGFAYRPPYSLAPGQPSPGMGYLPASLPRLPTTHRHHKNSRTLTTRRWIRLDRGCGAACDSVLARYHRYGNINPLSIDYACRPRLRSRLTQGGLAWPWNPWSFGGRVSHPSFATHACILTRMASTTGSPRRFTRHTTLPYPSTHLDRCRPGNRCE